MASKILLDNVSSNQTSDSFISTGGKVQFNVRGDDFDSGIVTFEIAAPNDQANRFIPIDNASFSAGATVTVDYLPRGSKIRCVLSNVASSATNIFASVIQ